MAAENALGESFFQVLQGIPRAKDPEGRCWFERTGARLVDRMAPRAALLQKRSSLLDAIIGFPLSGGQGGAEAAQGGE